MAHTLGTTDLRNKLGNNTLTAVPPNCLADGALCWTKFNRSAFR